MLKELDQVILTKRLEGLNLEPGDIGTVVLIHEGGRGFEVEFVTLAGATCRNPRHGRRGAADPSQRDRACPGRSGLIRSRPK